MFGWITNIAVGLLFFLHGARLSREAVIAGLTHWKLHLTIFSATFLMFPLLGMALKPVLEPLVTPELYLGILFLCCLPATVQSAIAFTSMARGNVPAAVCSASASSLLGIFLTPLLVGTVVANAGSAPSRSTPCSRSCCNCCCPSCWASSRAAGSAPGCHRRKAMLKFVDQGSILLVVYTAFSEAINEGLWAARRCRRWPGWWRPAR